MGVKVGAGGPGVPGHAPRKSWVLSWRLLFLKREGDGTAKKSRSHKINVTCLS